MQDHIGYLNFLETSKLKSLIHFCSVESNQYHSHSTIMTYQTNPEIRWPTTKDIAISTITLVEMFISSSSQLKMLVFTYFSSIVLYGSGFPSARTRIAESD